MRPDFRFRSILLAFLSAVAAGCAVTRPETALSAPEAQYRIYDMAARRPIDVATLARTLAGADVALFGERHDDDIAHRLQERLLRDLTAITARGTLGLEMFERDVQNAVDRYRAGETTEAAFLAEGRPWPNYPADYRPLVEHARDAGWGIAATNLPQALATAIARDGLNALEAAEPARRLFAAADIDCPEDAYWALFREAIAGDGGTPTQAAHVVEGHRLRQLYEAQCARDETMAEEIVRRLPDGLVFHVHGGFHSDFGHGIVPRIARRAPSARIVTISAIPTSDPARAPWPEHDGRADFVVLTPFPSSDR